MSDMIPATSFLLDGDTAIWVGPKDEADSARRSDHPCDTCPPSGVVSLHDGLALCPDCDGTGRHTFTVEVMLRDADPLYPFHRTFRVHVIDVLPIEFTEVHYDGWLPDQNFIDWDRDGAHVMWVGGIPTIITLPPDAVPAKWIARLAVHTPKNVDSLDG